MTQENHRMLQECVERFTDLSKAGAVREEKIVNLVEINRIRFDNIITKQAEIALTLDKIDNKLGVAVEREEIKEIHTRIDKLENTIWWLIKILAVAGLLGGTGVGIYQAVS